MTNRKENFKGGYTLLEVLFYIALFSILTFVVIDSLITMTRAFRQTTVQADLMSASSFMERISREIRQASSVNSISASDLKLNTKDELGNDKTVRFLLSGTDVQFFENDILTGNLNTPNIQVTALSFTHITIPTSNGKAVKFSLSAKSSRDTTNRVKNFYNTINFRGDYGI